MAVGTNYLSDCESATGLDAQAAASFVAGIRSVMAGCKEEFSLELACASFVGKLWFFAQVTRFLVNGQKCVVVALQNITQRRNDELALRQSEANYREFVEGTNDVVTQVDGEARIIYLNPAAARLFGLAPECCIGRSAFDFVHADDRVRTQTAFYEWVHNRVQSVSFENRCVNPAGEAHNLLWTINLHFAPDGSVTQINSIARDVTDQKAAEEALRRSEQDFRLFIESAPVAIAMFDTQMRYLAASARWLSFHGLTGNVIGLSHYFCSPEIPERWKAVHRRTLAGAVERCEEEMFIRADGTVTWLMWEVHPWHNTSGEVGGIVIFTEDITQRKKGEERLREREEMLRYIVKYDPNAIAVYDRDLHYIAVSDRYLKDYNVKEADVIGKHHYEVFPELPQKWKDVHQRCLAGAVEGSEDDYFERPDGSITYTSWECRPWYRNAQIGGIITYTEVTTERKLAEAALRAAKEQVDGINRELEKKVYERTAKLQETVEELEQFSYSITHDLRAPLRAIQGFTGLLEENCGSTLSSASHECINRIKNSIERMDKLIQDSLNYGKILIGQMPLEPVDVAALLHSMIQSYMIFQPPQAEIRVEGDFPIVLGNAAGLSQCVGNLLNNAVKFVAPGTKPCVRIWAEAKQNSVRLWFEDNGIGIAKDAQELIFGMFQQLSRSYEGTGIGLSIVRKAAERMGGKVGVESEPGKGSRFWLDLKRADRI